MLKTVDCPYCGETFDTLIDSSEGDSEYIEDCQICCSPITFRCQLLNDGELNVQTFNENDSY